MGREEVVPVEHHQRGGVTGHTPGLAPQLDQLPCRLGEMVLDQRAEPVVQAFQFSLRGELGQLGELGHRDIGDGPGLHGVRELGVVLLARRHRLEGHLDVRVGPVEGLRHLVGALDEGPEGDLPRALLRRGRPTVRVSTSRGEQAEGRDGADQRCQPSTKHDVPPIVCLGVTAIIRYVRHRVNASAFVFSETKADASLAQALARRRAPQDARTRSSGRSRISAWGVAGRDSRRTARSRAHAPTACLGGATAVSGVSLSSATSSS